MKTFKFFEKNQERVFTQWMDEMDDYHLGGIRPTWMQRQQPDETNPRHYDVDGFRCVGVSRIHHNRETYQRYKHLMFEHIETGQVIAANVITEEHPLWNHSTEINPRFYNSEFMGI